MLQLKATLIKNSNLVCFLFRYPLKGGGYGIAEYIRKPGKQPLFKKNVKNLFVNSK